MKKGDILVAIDPCYMKSLDKNALIVGKQYQVINDVDSRSDLFQIKSETADDHRFSISTINIYFKPIEEFYYGNEAVYPIVEDVYELGEKMRRPTEHGLTKREYFAGLAMQGMLSNPETYGDDEILVMLAVRKADLLLKQLKKK